MAILSEMRKKSSKLISMISEKSLAFKLLSAFIVIIVIVLSAYTFFSIRREQDKARKNLESKGQVLVNLLSYSSRLAAFSENQDQLRDVVSGFIHERDVLLVGIYSEHGKALYVQDTSSGTGISRNIGSRENVAGKDPQKTVTSDSGSAFEFIKPIVLQIVPNEERSLYFDESGRQATDRVIGYARIVLGQESLKREIMSIVKHNAVIALIFIAASVVLVYVRVRKITKPLDTLTQNVKSLGEGHEVAHVPVGTMDEVGRLATAFNTMLEERKIGREAFQKILMEIHDGIGGITTNIALLSELARKAISPESVSESLATISSLSKEGMTEIRSLMYSLDRKDMSWHTLSAELRNRGTKTLEPHSIAFEMDTDIEAGNPQPASLLCLHLFRIYREALTNVIKHSKAKNVKSSLRVHAGRIVLIVQDDGQGCDRNALFGKGRGVSHIMARAAELGGTASISTDDGTRVWLDIPISGKSRVVSLP